MTTTNLLLSIPFLLLAATGCTTEEPGDTPITNEKGEYAINFNGGLDLELTKSGSENLENGVNTTISAYKSGATDVAVASHGYTADGSGNFGGESSYTMYLARGSYDFYAVSCNSITKEAPAFTNGTSSSDLENGVDYIWAKAESQDIENTGKSITLGLAHKAVFIEITVKTAASTGIELISWESTVGADNDNATIMPPATSGCTMALSTGVITPATGVVSGVTASNMITTAVTGSSGYDQDKIATASYYILPLAKKDASNSYELPVTFKVKVKINGNSYTGDADTNGESKVYTANLTAPGSGYAFEAGKKYTYTATLKPNTISFTGATVTAWEEGVKESPLTPTEPEPAS
jgi:hypothetical protein